MKLLLIDSDRYWVEMLSGLLKMMGYDVSRAYTEEQAELAWTELQPDLVILDPILKEEGDALAMCRELRMKHDALVLVVTEEKGAADEVRCFEEGADDYLRKPFAPGQLLARIRALSRRGRSTLKLRPASVLTIGPLRVDSLNNTANVYGKTAHLTPTEGKMLYFLATNVNQVCKNEQMVTYVWGYDGDVSLIKAHIRHIRQKIESDPGTPRFIVTVPGIGYKLAYIAVEELAS